MIIIIKKIIIIMIIIIIMYFLILKYQGRNLDIIMLGEKNCFYQEFYHKNILFHFLLNFYKCSYHL
jgi:hypothetical protein